MGRQSGPDLGEVLVGVDELRLAALAFVHAASVEASPRVCSTTMSVMSSTIFLMGTVTKRQLNQHTAEVLADAVNGPVVVTERGIPRWRIEAIDVHPDPVERLRAEGRIRPARKEPAVWPLRNAQGRTPADVDARYQEMRGDH